MTVARPTILWDFEGTLVYRLELWRSVLIEVLDDREPGHGIDMEQIRPYLRDGFYWHKPNEPHLHIKTANAWWSELEPVFERAYLGVGFDAVRAKELAKLVREYFINPKRFIIYDDVVSVLNRLTENGWRHAILSNHVPELPEIVKALGLLPFFELCLTSAATGWEKPNPEAFRNAMSLLGEPQAVWVIGDNVVADVKGAEAVGLPAILVRSPKGGDVQYYAPDLLGAAAIIESTDQ